MRVIAGRYGGRRLRAPSGAATRPTSERVREAVFSMLGPLDGARVLDLFAGSGALGIEAISRGATQVTFVERSPAARAVLAANLAALGIPGTEARVRGGDARPELRAAVSRGEAYDLVFLDPPYLQAEALGPALARPLADVLAPGGRVVCESDRRRPLELGLPLDRERRYGDTLIRLHSRPEPPKLTPSNRIAVCPGSYDPITNGHLDVITRAAALFDMLIVAVVDQSVRKSNTLFGIDDRLGFIREATAHLPGVRVEPFDTLVVDFARAQGAKAIVKGLRAISDFEYELEMNQLNRLQAPEIESIYLMASSEYSFLSSSGVKELAMFGGNVEHMVPPSVVARLQEVLKP